MNITIWVSETQCVPAYSTHVVVPTGRLINIFWLHISSINLKHTNNSQFMPHSGNTQPAVSRIHGQ
jgi:hypothetical protein